MLLGYNTNGFAHHTLADTVAILSEIGYRSVALTLERAHLDPPDRGGVAECLKKIGPVLRRFDLRLTIETGARFILDPRRKHQPTLLSREPAGRQKRIEFLMAAIDLAAELEADSVSLWSGSADDDAAEEELFDRLARGLTEVLEHATARDVRLSFEPEPGMFIDSMTRFARLYEELDHPLFGLTLDVGHVYCLSDGQVEYHLRRWSDRLWNLHVEDMRRGLHEHLMFGEGEMDFATVFEVLNEIGYAGPVHVELPHHSHDAVKAAERSYAFLRRFVKGANSELG